MLMHLGVAHAITKQQRTANAVRLLRALNPRAKRRKVPRKVWPMNAERDYARALRDLTVRAVAPPLARLIGELPSLVLQAKNATRIDARLRLDAGEARKLVDESYRAMMSRLDIREIANVVNRHARSVSGHNLKQLGRQLSAAFGVEVAVPDQNTPRTIDAFIDQNVSLVIDNVERLVGNIEKDITRILASTRIDARGRLDARQSLPAASNVRLIVRRPEDLDMQGLAAAVTRNVSLGGTNAELAQEIEERFGFARDHAEFIARDQVGKLNGQLDAQRQQGLGIKRFVWRTVGDERVREEHEERDGQTYDYDDPPDGELPGEPINCRCSAEPVFDDIFEEEGATGAVQVPSEIVEPKETNEPDRDVRPLTASNAQAFLDDVADKPLLASETKSLRDYQGGRYVLINDFARTGELEKDSLLGSRRQADALLKSIDSAIAKGSTPSDALVFRGVKFEADVRQGITGKLEVGSTIRDKGYSSTSTSRDVAKEFGSTLLEIEMPKGTRAAFIPGDGSMQESELLLARGSRFKVLSVREVDGKNVARVRLVQ